MFCNKCGARIPDDAAFCMNCGSQIEAAPVEEAPVEILPVKTATVEAAPALPVDSQQREAATKIMTFGIIACAFTLSFYLAGIGIIFAAITFSKWKAYEREYGPAQGKAQVGKIMSLVCLPLSIVYTVFASILVLYIIAVYSFVFVAIWEPLLKAIGNSGGYRYY